jgi:hypothetical protein
MMKAVTGRMKRCIPDEKKRQAILIMIACLQRSNELFLAREMYENM